MKPKVQPAEYEVPQPKELQSCIEFEVHSHSQNPELGGVIQVRAEPERVGVRWAGEKVWTWLEWTGLMVLGADWPETMKQIIAERYELAYEEGLAAGLDESFGKEVEKAVGLHVVRHSKLRQMPPPDDAA